VVYTLFPIIYDIAIKQNIRPERPMAVASVSSQLGICASPVSVAVVSMVSVLGAAHGVGKPIGILELLSVSIPASFCGMMLAAIWSMRRGKPLDQDPEFQEKIKDPEQKKYIYGETQTLLNQVLPKESYWATWIFFAAIALLVFLGASDHFRPWFGAAGKMKPLNMTYGIQMLMLMAGALIMIICKVKPQEMPKGNVFKAGCVAVISVFGVAWMADSFFAAHMALLKNSLADIVKVYPWAFAIVLFFTSKFVNSQAAAVAAITPLGISLGVDPRVMVAFAPAMYGYFVLPTYPSDLACISFDRSGTCKIGKFIINHSFIIPGLIGVITGCAVGYVIAHVLYF
jgi:anaerobic C4-dicarboxylate transporter DcuB